jgi:hypothetical protein
MTTLYVFVALAILLGMVGVGIAILNYVSIRSLHHTGHSLGRNLDLLSLAFNEANDYFESRVSQSVGQVRDMLEKQNKIIFLQEQLCAEMRELQKHCQQIREVTNANHNAANGNTTNIYKKQPEDFQNVLMNRLLSAIVDNVQYKKEE